MKRIFLTIITIILISNILSTEPKKIGLVLSGGGARGLVHIGFLKVIDEVGLDIDYIAGTSFGALVGAMYSLGYSAEDIENIFIEEDFADILNDTIDRGDLYIEDKRWFDYGNLSFEIDKNLDISMPLSLLPGNNILLYLTKYLSRSIYYDDFESLPIPFRCVATDLETGESVEFKDGNLIGAVRASMAFPSVLEPFIIDDKIYIDGGVRANLPVDTALNMGANYIIANKANSPLRSREQCDNLLEVLDQTININMSQWVDQAIKKTDLLVSPVLDGFSSVNFDEIKDLIQIGEDAAREHIDDFKQLAQEQKLNGTKRNNKFVIPHRIRINKIIASSSNQLSGYKIKLLTGLEEGETYTIDEILTGVKECYNSGLFTWAYPRIIYEKGVYNLEIITKEKAKGYLNLDISYTSSDDLVFGISTTLNNVVQKNSKLLANLKLGAINSFTLDYVKNFGELYGGYFRLFPYVSEQKLYNYNFEDEISNRVTSLQMGGNVGVGFFIKNFIIGEAFIYTTKDRLYQDISEVDFEEDEFKSTGFGFKAYHETLDDLYFPTYGTMFAFKYKHSFKEFMSDEDFDKYHGLAKVAIPIHDRFSFSYQFEGGSFRNENLAKQFTPFSIGGVDSFHALDKSSSQYSTFVFSELGMTYNYNKTYFSTFSAQNLIQNEDNDFTEVSKSARAFCLEFGYKSPVGPVRVGLVSDDDFEVTTYFAFGYTLNMFSFSGN
jgi:NTE family protein